MDMKLIGRFLSELRKSHGMTQEQLGERLGVTGKTISRWETGNYLPPVDMLLELSRMYDLSINELLTGKKLTAEEDHEAAEKNLKGFTVRMTHPGSSEIERINEVIGEHTIKKLGFEENDMTYGDYLRYNEALHAVLVPMQAKIDAFRATKEPWEIELMRKAQAITDQTFSELCKIIQAGMTEKELEAELLYRLYKHGAEGPSFDPIRTQVCRTASPASGSSSSATSSRWTSAASTAATAPT